MDPIDLLHPSLPTSPNFALAAPKDSQLPASLEVPTFALEASALAKKVVAFIKDQPRISVVEQNWAAHHFVFIQRSLIFRFPDQIEIQIMPVDGNRASFVMLSRAQYGYYDFGVNRRRVEHWIKAMQQQF